MASACLAVSFVPILARSISAWYHPMLLLTAGSVFFYLCVYVSLYFCAWYHLYEPPFLGKFPEMGWKQVVVPVEWDWSRCYFWWELEKTFGMRANNRFWKWWQSIYRQLTVASWMLYFLLAEIRWNYNLGKDGLESFINIMRIKTICVKTDSPHFICFYYYYFYYHVLLVSKEDNEDLCKDP